MVETYIISNNNNVINEVIELVELNVKHDYKFVCYFNLFHLIILSIVYPQHISNTNHVTITTFFCLF